MKFAKGLVALVFVAAATFLSTGTASAAGVPCNSINVDPCCGFRACDGPS